MIGDTMIGDTMTGDTRIGDTRSGDTIPLSLPPPFFFLFFLFFRFFLLFVVGLFRVAEWIVAKLSRNCREIWSVAKCREIVANMTWGVAKLSRIDRELIW